MSTLRARRLPRRIRAFLYDFDNTIVGTERMNEELFADLLAGEYGAPVSPPERGIIRELPWSGVFEWLSEHKGLSGRRSEIWARFMEVKRERLRRGPLAVATGLDRMLGLPAAHAIVTGSLRDELAMVMTAAGLTDRRFAAILCAEDYTRGKPDPEGYLRALAALSVPADEALVFEDSRPGIAAAHMAGIPVAFVSELASQDLASHADMAFRDLVEAWETVRDRVEVL